LIPLGFLESPFGERHAVKVNDFGHARAPILQFFDTAINSRCRCHIFAASSKNRAAVPGHPWHINFNPSFSFL
jgi:hypothetical protein